MCCMCADVTSLPRACMTAHRLTCFSMCALEVRGWQGGHMTAGKQRRRSLKGPAGCSLLDHRGVPAISLFRLFCSSARLSSWSGNRPSAAASQCYATVVGNLWKEVGEESIDGKQVVAMVASFLSPSSPAPLNDTSFLSLWLKTELRGFFNLSVPIWQLWASVAIHRLVKSRVKSQFRRKTWQGNKKCDTFEGERTEHRSHFILLL